MSQFNFENIMQHAYKVAETKKAKRGGIQYALYYGNHIKQPEGKIVGNTVAYCIKQFRENGGDKQYANAAIIRIKDGKLMSMFVRSYSSKFFTDRTRKTKK